MTKKKVDCFGFFNSSVDCVNCVAQKRCRAITISDGFDALEDLLETMIEQEAASGVPFIDQNKVSDLVGQVINRKSRETLVANKSAVEELFG